MLGSVLNGQHHIQNSQWNLTKIISRGDSVDSSLLTYERTS